MNLDGYRKCERCGAGLSTLYPGGVGDWRSTILCQNPECFHIRRNVPFESVILPLASEKWGVSEQRVREWYEELQDEYLSALADRASG